VSRTRSQLQPTRTNSFFEPLEQRELMAGGTLDPTFGTGGKATTGFHTNDVAVQADGKTVAVGWAGSDFAVMRFNVDGKPDASFGPGGLRTTDFGGKKGEMAYRVAIQGDGKIVVAGLKINSGFGPSTKANFALARYNTNGTLDAGFGSGGSLTVLGEENTYTLGGVGVQPGGKIVFSSTVKRGGDQDFIVVRLHGSGMLDTTFGDKSGSGFKGYAIAGFGGNEYASEQIIEPNGKIIVAGTQYGGTQVNSPSGQFALARFTASGQLDKSFSNDGKTSTTMGRGAFLGGIARQPDGKIVAAGSMNRAGTNNGSELLLRRFNADGSYDNTLRNGSVLTTPFADSRSSIGNAVLVRDNKILVLGEDYTAQGRRLFTARYLLNGATDMAFGTGGVARLDIGTAPSWPRAALAPEGKVVVGFEGTPYQASGAARFVGFEAPQVQIVSRIPDASEAGPTIGAVVVKRQGGDQSTALRVYLDVTGTATLDKDYTTTLKTTQNGNARSGGTIGFILGGALGGKIGGVGGIGGVVHAITSMPFIDIPAGQTSVTVPLSVINDGTLEPVETATFTIAASPTYAISGADKSATVSIADDEELHVNFQPAGAPAPAGYAADTGAVFGDRGAGMSFGWDRDNRAHARRRNSTGSPDARYDTYTHMQKAGGGTKWEVALPNGMYQVRIVAGDSSATDSFHAMNLEGTPVLIARPGVPTPDARWFRSTANVLVSDGRLTLSNYSEAKNNKIAFIDIKAAPIGGKVEVLTPVALPVRLYGPATASLWHRTPSGVFADNQIDEPLWA